MRTPFFFCIAAGASLLSACSESTSVSDASVDAGVRTDMAIDAGTDAGSDAGPLVGQPIVAPDGTWTWIDFPNSACDDGTPTGLGVRLNSTSDDLLIFFNGGGACWSYTTCVVASTSTHGPMGASEFAAAQASLGAGSIFDASDVNNPFRNYSMIYVPYCTGDLHAGSVVTTYREGDASRDIHHVGHDNVLAYVSRLAATFPAPRQVVVSGGSAGGGGALFNYPLLRATWPSATMMMIDDSLPLVANNGIPFLSEMFSQWQLGELIDPLCGDACHSDLSQYMRVLAEAYPGDRMALLSSKRDAVVRAYFQLSPENFEAALDTLTSDVLDPHANFRHFYVAGEAHTMLGAPSRFLTDGTTLKNWLGKMVSGDAAWASIAP